METLRPTWTPQARGRGRCGTMGCPESAPHAHQYWQLWTRVRDDSAGWEPFGDPWPEWAEFDQLISMLRLEGVYELLEVQAAPFGFPPNPARLA